MTALDPAREAGFAAAPGGAAALHGTLLVAAGLIVLAVAVFWPSMLALAELWSHPDRRTYQHGYLIAVLASWLVYRERGRIAAAAGAAAPRFLAAAAVGSVAWAVAWNAGLQVVHFLIWPAVLWSALAAALGPQAGRVLLLPVAFIYFAMPVWDVLTPVLQLATVHANQVLAALVNMPVIIEDTYVHIPQGSFEIAGGCSGLNYLIVGLAIATLLGEVNRDTLRRRLLLIALGGAMAIVSNWLRVFIIIYAGHVSDMTHYLVRVDHYNFGWVLYAFVLAGFFLIARRLPDSGEPQEEPAGNPGGRAGVVAVGAAAVAMALGPLLSQASMLLARDAEARAAIGVQALDFDPDDEWLAMPAIGDWVPVFPGADAESLVEFTRGEERVTAYTATYLSQAQGRELVGHESRVQGAGQGRLLPAQRRGIEGDLPSRVLEAEWRGAGGGRALIWWIYQVDGRPFASPLAAQLWYGVFALWGTAPVSSVIALHTSCAGDCDLARTTLERFAVAALPRLLAAAGYAGG
ncbi:MAG TPA: exosortase A [Steroidobacteraceae bacterium]|nr:exosortase A [Steroidobacteraceae bacterium]